MNRRISTSLLYFSTVNVFSRSVCTPKTTTYHYVTIQVTTHSKLLSTLDVGQLDGVAGIKSKHIQTLALQAFGTEQEFSRKLRYLTICKSVNNTNCIGNTHCISSS